MEEMTMLRQTPMQGDNGDKSLRSISILGTTLYIGLAKFRRLHFVHEVGC